MRPPYLGENLYGEARRVLAFLSSLENELVAEVQEKTAIWCAADSAHEFREEIAAVALREWPRLECDPNGMVERRLEVFSRGASFGSSETELGEAAIDTYFGDLPLFRRLGPQPVEWTDEKLVHLVNRARVNRLVASAFRVEIIGAENIATLVRVARTLRLMIWIVRRGERTAIVAGSSARGHSRHFLEGRALCGVVHRALATPGACVDVFTDTGSKEPFRLLASDPIGALPPLNSKRLDSLLERRIEKWLRKKKGIQWELEREVQPLRIEGHFVFPDFRLTRNLDGASFEVEVVGFWTEDYLAKKLRLAHAMQGTNLVFILDASLIPKSERAASLSQADAVFVIQKDTSPERFFEWLEGRVRHLSIA